MGKTTQRKRMFHVAVFVDITRGYRRELLAGVADYVETHGPWSLFIEPHASDLDPVWLRRWQGDGVLVLAEEHPGVTRTRRMNIPTVETYGYATKLKLPCVGNDDVAIGRLAAKHLLERRFRNFAFSGYPDQPWAERRCRGFVQVVREAGYACEVGHYPRSFDTLRAWEQARQQLTAWLKQLPKPLGLMACSDRHAQNILDACRRARIALPDEVAVIGSDNNEAICRLSDPPLSSVADDPRQIGYEAARLLDRLMSGKADPAETESLLVPPKYVVTRRSTDLSVVDDELVAEALHFIRERAFEPINVSIMLQKNVGIAQHVVSAVSQCRGQVAARGVAPHMTRSREGTADADFATVDSGCFIGRVRTRRIHGDGVQAAGGYDANPISRQLP